MIIFGFILYIRKNWIRKTASYIIYYSVKYQGWHFYRQLISYFLTSWAKHLLKDVSKIVLSNSVFGPCISGYIYLKLRGLALRPKMNFMKKFCVHSCLTRYIHKRLIDPSPWPLGLKGVFWGSNNPLYLVMAGPVAEESAKHPGMKFSGAWLKFTNDSITDSFQVSVILKEAYTSGLANGSSKRMR